MPLPSMTACMSSSLSGGAARPPLARRRRSADMATLGSVPTPCSLPRCTASCKPTPTLAADFDVLVRLTGSPDGWVRVSDLARGLHWGAQPDLPHLTGMEGRSLVRREECRVDGRRAWVVLTQGCHRDRAC